MAPALRALTHLSLRNVLWSKDEDGSCMLPRDSTNALPWRQLCELTLLCELNLGYNERATTAQPHSRRTLVRCDSCARSISPSATSRTPVRWAANCSACRASRRSRARKVWRTRRKVNTQVCRVLRCRRGLAGATSAWCMMTSSSAALQGGRMRAHGSNLCNHLWGRFKCWRTAFCECLMCCFTHLQCRCLKLLVESLRHYLLARRIFYIKTNALVSF